MRVKKILKNIIYALLTSALNMILLLILRKVFLDTLSTEYLGYDGLFTNLFGFLTLADMGVSSIISYRLFDAFANNRKDLIDQLVAVYRTVCKYIATVIFAVGLMLIPFLKYIIKDGTLDWPYVYRIYIIQLAGISLPFFLDYNRTIFVIDQKSYVNVRMNAVCNAIGTVIKIIVLLTMKDYIVYCYVNLATKLTESLLIYRKAKTEYSFINPNRRVRWNEIKELNITGDIKSGIVKRIAMTVYNSTDNIIISAFLGIAKTGLLTNYTLISTGVTTVFRRVFEPFGSAIGNYVYSESNEEGTQIYHMLNLLSFLIASFMAVSYIVLFNPFISLFFGTQYLLGNLFVVAFAVNQYLIWVYFFHCQFRDALGYLDEDRNYFLVAAMLNIVSSILLAKPFGIAGVLMGTAISEFVYWIGRTKVLYKHFIKEPVSKYIILQLKYSLICIAEIAVSVSLARLCPANWIGFVGRAVICLVVPNAVNLIMFMKTEEFSRLKNYLLNIKEYVK